MTTFPTSTPVSSTSLINGNSFMEDGNALVSPVTPEEDTSPLLPVNLNATGYEKAEQHRGNALALENLLNRVLRGYLVEERADDDHRKRHEQRTHEQMLALEKQAADARTRIRQINESELPAVQDQLAELDGEILQIRKDEAAGLRDPNHLDRVKLWLYGGITLLATGAVYLFYVSSFYSAFYRDLASELIAAGPEGQTGVLAAIFAAKAYQTFDFHWVGPVFLFAFGMFLHVLLEMPGRWAKAGLVVLILGMLGLDGLLAFFVENKQYSVKLMMGMAKETDAHSAWAEPIFWVVIVLGFGTALVWSGLLHAWMNEVSKKDVRRITALDIAHRRDRQIPLKARITDLKTQLLELEGQIARLELDIKALLESQQAVVFSPSELEKYVTDFYDGWLTYVNNRMSNEASLRDACDAVLKAFYAQHLSSEQ